MKHLFWTGPFKKNVKRLTKRGYEMKKMYQILWMLKREEPLPSRTRLHLLQGKWAGHWECHIESDWLLVYKVIGNEISLARTGTHADLFE